MITGVSVANMSMGPYKTQMCVDGSRSKTQVPSAESQFIMQKIRIQTGINSWTLSGLESAKTRSVKRSVPWLQVNNHSYGKEKASSFIFKCFFL